MPRHIQIFKIPEDPSPRTPSRIDWSRPCYQRRLECQHHSLFARGPRCQQKETGRFSSTFQQSWDNNSQWLMHYIARPNDAKALETNPCGHKTPWRS